MPKLETETRPYTSFTVSAGKMNSTSEESNFLDSAWQGVGLLEPVNRPSRKYLFDSKPQEKVARQKVCFVSAWIHKREK